MRQGTEGYRRARARSTSAATAIARNATEPSSAGQENMSAPLTSHAGGEVFTRTMIVPL
jgi:hypothetical protein